MNGKIQSLQREQEMLENIQQENEHLKRKVGEISEMSSRITDYEYKI